MSFPDETSESESSVSPYRHWAYVGKMPPHARKLTAKSAPSKATPTATPTPTATTPPAPAVAATAAAPSLASALAPAFQAKVVPPVKSKVKRSFLYKDAGTPTPPPAVQTAVPAAASTPKDLTDVMVVDDNHPPPHRSQPTTFLLKSTASISEPALDGSDPESEEHTLASTSKNTKELAPSPDTAPSMVEVTKVREMVSHLRAHLIERQIALHDGLEAEKAFTDKLDEFMASLPE
ncbi:hypothetical protein H4582DRAFT_2054782 [Lactarius indigo]|nr:hypothetical protein H4582DRAFT_2054782 [Lactarius indigo]